MKKIALFLTLAIVSLTCAHGQAPADSTQSSPAKGDTAMAATIIDNYIGFINFDHLLKDSVLAVVSYVVDQYHTDDTITIYRWYAANHQNRIEMWQKGRMEDAYFCDGTSTFMRFVASRREWVHVTQISYYDLTTPLDIRGALYNWRGKGAEASYMGQYEYKGHPVHRVFVSSPEIFDRNYFFEKETGLLFILTEDDHIFGDAKPSINAHRVDWRAWHEFTPFHGCLLPSIESYQVKGQIVVMHHNYSLEAYNKKLFTEEYRKR